MHGLSRCRVDVSGSFTAASNLTGALEDVAKITKVLHQGGALSFWDYATAAPYVNIDMNPPGSCEGDEVSAGANDRCCTVVFDGSCRRGGLTRLRCLSCSRFDGVWAGWFVGMNGRRRSSKVL